MQHESGVSVDEFDQSEEEALVASSVKFCGSLFEFKAGGHLPFERQTLWEQTARPLWLDSDPLLPYVNRDWTNSRC